MSVTNVKDLFISQSLPDPCKSVRDVCEEVLVLEGSSLIMMGSLDSSVCAVADTTLAGAAFTDSG